MRLAAGPARETFRSSGTTGGERSVHEHPFPELYRAAIDASFPAFRLPTGTKPVMLALVPTRQQRPDSSLGFMVDHVLSQWGAPGSTYAFGARGVDFAAARSWLAARQRDHRPALILATGLALADLLAFLQRMDLRLRLPVGSAVFVTGGNKGRTRELGGEERLRLLGEYLALPAERVVGEYGMTELSSQCYSRALLGGELDLYFAPHWMRVRLLDPETLAEVPPGTPGLVALFDLANLGSALHLATADLGVASGEGFRLLGRLPGAEPRGCSLLVEELSAGE